MLPLAATAQPTGPASGRWWDWTRDRVDWVANRPHYAYQPRQLLRRLRAPRDRIELPWGLPLSVDPTEHIGLTLNRNGVYELAVSEVLHRLADPGELAADVGANIGYMSSVLAATLGPAGELFAFEPHPGLFERLVANTSSWEQVATVRTTHAAASSGATSASLTVTAEFATNAGSASVWEGSAGTQGAGVTTIEVPAVTLDEVLSGRRIGVVKIDVEGHEPDVLRGASGLLAGHAIRDVVYEDHHGYPAEASRLLEEAGYTVYAIEQRLRGPALVDPGSPRNPHRLPQNYLGTVDLERARSRLAPRGWRVLRRR